MKEGFNSNLLQYPQPGLTSSEDTSPIETQQNSDVPGSSTTSFQHSGEEIVREQSENQALDACKSSIVVELAEVLYDLKPCKELGYDKIYQFYKKSFRSHKK